MSNREHAGLYHADATIRCSAMRALCSKALKAPRASSRLDSILNVSHDEDDLTTMIRFLNDKDASCRIQALRCIADMAPVGHIVSVSAVIRHLQDSDHLVRINAIDTLSRISKRRDRNVTSAIIYHLRGTAVKDRTRPGNQRNGGTHEFLGLNRMPTSPWDASFSSDPDARIAAVRALGVLCDDDDVAAVSCVGDLAATERDERVLQAAINVLVAFGKPALVEDVRQQIRAREHRELGIMKKDKMHVVCEGMKAALPLCANDRAALWR